MVRLRQLGVPKLKERERAIDLRRKGLTYSEILKHVHVAKSTLSVWLGEVGLTQKQTQRITDKKRAAMLRGSARRRSDRIVRTKQIVAASTIDVAKYMHDPLFLLGLSLYWAEGSKQKEWSVSQPVVFSNMDVRTHQVFITWVEKYLHTPRVLCTFQLYLSDSISKGTAVAYWQSHLHIPPERINVYAKHPGGKSVRHNAKKEYYGVLRIVVPRSTDLNRMISGWIEGVIKYVL